MNHNMRGLSLTLLLLACSACTVVKPVVGIVTGPFHVMHELGRSTGGGSIGLRATHGNEAAMVVALFAGVVLVAGPIGGLVTGVRSDYYVLVGEAREPTRNLANPFRTNVEPRR